jgi:peptidoglycan/xylan/chitin deacetylase (PgdA/CDA1 family)
MKRSVTRFLLIVAVVCGIGALGFTFWLRDRYVVPILTYHHVGPCTNKVQNLNTVSAASFEYQMRFLRRHGYQVISFDDWVEGVNKGYSFARNTVIIHFDDGYEDNFTNAFPILKKEQFPAMVFLVSDVIGTPGFLSWDQVKEMEDHDFTAGAHTRHHQYLPDLPLDKARDEIAGSKKVIEQHLGHPIEYFVYPSGGFNQETKKLVQEAGFKAAGTTNRGKDKFNHDLFALNRIRIKDSDNRYGGLILWAKLSGYYNLFRQTKVGSKDDIILK